MKIILIMMAVALFSTSPMTMAVENQIENVVSEAKKKPKPEPKPKPVPCACVCPGTFPGTKWSCSPTGCSAKDGTYCSAGGPSQSPLETQSR